MANCDLLIIGSGPAAWSCALTARQRDLSVVVAAAQSATGWLQKAERIDNYPGMPAVSGSEMLRVFRHQAEDAGAQVIDSLARQVQPLGDIYMTLCGNDIIESRMKAARAYLTDSDLAVQRIAELCGYRNTEHFIRQFKQRNGVTPAVYRKQFWNGGKTHEHPQNFA